MVKKNEEYITTGEAAARCGLSSQIIQRFFDEGTLAGFTVPGSAHRRIDAVAFQAFCTANNIPYTDANE